MQICEFLSIKNPVEGIYKSKGSKFLAYAYPFEQEAQLKTILEMHKKNHFKAVHFCYAYKLGADGKDFRINDDREPSGTAGLPILSQIESRNLTNILVLVVRYFGGTLLGVSGLIKAYKEASKDALDKAQIYKQQISVAYILQTSYADLNQVLYKLEKMQIKLVAKNMQLACELELAVPLNQEASFLQYAQTQNLTIIPI